MDLMAEAMEEQLRAQQRMEVALLIGTITFCVVTVGMLAATIAEARRPL